MTENKFVNIHWREDSVKLAYMAELLSRKHCCGNNVKRLHLVKVHKNWTIKHWNKVLSTDKSMFEVYGSNRRLYVQRRLDERAVTRCITPTVKHRKGSVMVWEACAICKVGDLHQVEYKLNQTGFHSILQRHTITSGTWLVDHEFLHMQANDPKHTSKLCQMYIKSLEEQPVLRRMSWPVQSTDLNPIELLLGELERKVKVTQPTNAAHHWQLL